MTFNINTLLNQNINDIQYKYTFKSTHQRHSI